MILGVRTAGSQLAQRIAGEIESVRKHKPELGEIEMYGSGDEIRRIAPADPDAGPLNLKDREVILVDDVIYTGRTVKSALSIIFRSARPQSVRLAVLIDRGHREVPVKPNYVGKNIPSSETGPRAGQAARGRPGGARSGGDLRAQSARVGSAKVAPAVRSESGSINL